MKYLTVRVDRRAAGRFGLNAAEVQRALRVWVDGAAGGHRAGGRGAHPPDGARRGGAAPLRRTTWRGCRSRCPAAAPCCSPRSPRSGRRRAGPGHPRAGAALRHGAGQRARPRPGGLRRRGARRGGARVSAAARLPAGMGRPVREPAARLGAAGHRGADRARPDLPAALPDLRLGAAGGAGVLQRALRGDRRRDRRCGSPASSSRCPPRSASSR